MLGRSKCRAGFCWASVTLHPEVKRLWACCSVAFVRASAGHAVWLFSPRQLPLCVAEWHALHSQSCALALSPGLFSYGATLLYPLNNLNLFLGFLFLVLIVWVPHISGITQCLSFCGGLTSLCTMFLVRISSLKAPVRFYPAHLSFRLHPWYICCKWYC